MFIIENIIQSIQALMSNKIRAFLSVLWLVIWVFSVTVMVSVWEWLKEEVLWEFSEEVKKTITIVAWDTFNPFETKRNADLPWFSESDINFFYESMWFIEKITPISELSEEVKIKWQKVTMRVLAWSKEYVDMESLDFIVWRNLNEDDNIDYKNVIIVSDNAIEEYFKIDVKDSIWKEILIWDQFFSIIWVVKNKSAWFMDMKMWIIPINTAQKKITSDPFYPYLIFKINDSISSQQATKLVKYTLLKWQWVNHMDDALFKVYSTETMLEQISNITNMLQLALLWIWAISLIVWWIWVMNIMLVSVTERTREIWIRKAIWAKYSDILLQFLIESIILWLLWCLLWVLVSWWVISLLQKFNIPALLNIRTIIIAVLFSATTWIIFWVWPARKAAKMKPIDALRYE